VKERLTRVVLNLTPGQLTWLSVGAVLLAYEVWAVFSPAGDVLTRAWRADALRWIIIPVGSGFLMGHLNGPSLPYLSKWTPALGFGTLGLALAYGLLTRTPLPDVYRAPLFLFGFALGVLTWSGRP
jgi:hypothetical protein